jgi:uncharacterized protein
MRWQGRRESDNVEDRRDDGGGYSSPGGFGMPSPSEGGSGGFQIPMGQGGGVGIIGIIVIVGIALLLGVDPSVLLNGGADTGGGRQIQLPNDRQPRIATAEDDSMKRFVSVVLADTEDTWTTIFRNAGRRYQPPKLVLFRGGIRSRCGQASSQTGPFYCPNDQKIYIDLAFFELLKSRFKAPGEFAQAYVIAHEVGHHVQNLEGRLQSAQRLQMAAAGSERNAIQVKVELQADCYSGVWAKNTDRINKTLDPGDIEQALQAASAIGDDAIQRKVQGYVVPDSFTHGTSTQRVRWFKRGYDSGSVSSCDTFGTQTL